MFWIPAWQSQLVQLSVWCSLWHGERNRWVGGSGAVSGYGIDIIVCAFQTVIIFDKQDTEGWCKPPSAALHHHLPQIFNLSRAVVGEFDHGLGIRALRRRVRQYPAAKISGTCTNTAYKSDYRELLFCNLAVNHYHLWKRQRFVWSERRYR